MVPYREVYGEVLRAIGAALLDRGPNGLTVVPVLGATELLRDEAADAGADGMLLAVTGVLWTEALVFVPRTTGEGAVVLCERSEFKMRTRNLLAG